MTELPNKEIIKQVICLLEVDIERKLIAADMHTEQPEEHNFYMHAATNLRTVTKWLRKLVGWTT